MSIQKNGNTISGLISGIHFVIGCILFLTIIAIGYFGVWEGNYNFDTQEVFKKIQDYDLSVVTYKEPKRNVFNPSTITVVSEGGMKNTYLIYSNFKGEFKITKPGDPEEIVYPPPAP